MQVSLQKLYIVCLAAVSCLVACAPVQSASFEGLGDLSGGVYTSDARAVSADGSVVVGISQSTSGDEAFRWTAQTQMQPLGDLTGGSFYSVAEGVSADGSVVVGSSESASGREAFVWAANVMTGLGDLTGGGFFSQARGLSADGLVIVGSSDSAAGRQAFRWTSVDGMLPLNDLPNGDVYGEAVAVTPDGSMAVGYGDTTDGYEAAYWVGTSNPQGISTLGGLSFYSSAYGVSANGYIVGASISPSGWEAFRWRQDSGFLALGDLDEGDYYSEARGVSADGAIVVGTSNTAAGFEAFIWDSVHNMRSLKQVLEQDYGLDLTGWTLTRANAISADGSTIVGRGIDPQGRTQAWRAMLTAPQASPPPPVVTDDGVGTTSTTQLHASWTDAAGAGVAEYQMAVGTTPLANPGDFVTPWVSQGVLLQGTAGSLNLTKAQRYYIYVRARGATGPWSAPGISDGILVVHGAFSSPGAARLLEDGKAVLLQSVIQTSDAVETSGRGYVQANDRSSGIGVASMTGAKGDSIDVAGILATVDGERVLTDAAWLALSHPGEPVPLASSGEDFQSGPLFYNPVTGAGQRGTTSGAQNLSTIGLLMRIFGRVTSAGPGFFTITDGAPAEGGSIRIETASFIAPAAVGDFVAVTGVSGLRHDDPSFLPVIRARSAQDIQNLIAGP